MEMPVRETCDTVNYLVGARPAGGDLLWPSNNTAISAVNMPAKGRNVWYSSFYYEAMVGRYWQRKSRLYSCYAQVGVSKMHTI